MSAQDDARAVTREQVLRAFDVTAEEIAAFDEASGYRAAREQADRERAQFLAHVERVDRDMMRALRLGAGVHVTRDSTPL